MRSWILEHLFLIVAIGMYVIGLTGWTNRVPWYVSIPVSLVLGLMVAHANAVYDRSLVKSYIKTIKEKYLII